MIGDNEVTNNTVSVNVRGVNKTVHDIPLDEFISACTIQNDEYALILY